MRGTRTSEQDDRPRGNLGAVLVHYGGEPIPDHMQERMWFPYKCPFHGDRNASASVNTIIQVFKCHTCDMKGAAIDLIMKEDGLDFRSALVRYEEITGESYGHVRFSSGEGSAVSRRARNRQGRRTRGRTWRSD